MQPSIGFESHAFQPLALLKRVKEAIELCLEIEEPAATEFIGVQRIAVGP